MKKPSLTKLTHLALQINSVIEDCPDHELAFREVYHQTDIGCLIEFLERRFADHVDFHFLTVDPDEHLALDLALSTAAEALQGAEIGLAWIQKSGLGRVMAIILEAIQQNVPKVLPPEEELAVASSAPATE